MKCARTRHVEEMRGKDIRNSEELNSQKQKQSQYQQSVDQTLNAKMMDGNNEIFKHDAEFPRIQDSRCSRSGSATREGGQGGDPELTTTIRKSVTTNECYSEKFNPIDTFLTMTPLESGRKGRM